VASSTLFEVKLFERLNQLFRFFDIEKAAKLLSLVNLMEEKFRFTSKLFVSKRRQLTQTMFEGVEVGRAVFVKLHKPRLFLRDHGVNLEFMLLEESFYLLISRSYSSPWDANTVAKRNRSPEDF
jgi:hypothetical protein